MVIKPQLKKMRFFKIPKKSGLWDLFIHIHLNKNHGLQKYRMSEFCENPQNLFS
jgi:hypothetical protein